MRSNFPDESLMLVLATSFYNSGKTGHTSPLLHIQEKLRRLFLDNADTITAIMLEYKDEK